MLLAGMPVELCNCRSGDVVLVKQLELSLASPLEEHLPVLKVKLDCIALKCDNALDDRLSVVHCCLVRDPVGLEHNDISPAGRIEEVGGKHPVIILQRIHH